MKKFIDMANKMLARSEQIGFKAANFGHKMTINLLLVGMGYTVYTMFRDYNENFREERMRSMQELEQGTRVDPLKPNNNQN